MKPIENPASSNAGLAALSAETKLCFGAAGGCLVIGALGSAINVLTAKETTLSAFLVISAFYLLLGVISLIKTSSDLAHDKRAIEEDDELIESAA
jgi:hypothetical protein